jgi:RecA-family ATPase
LICVLLRISVGIPQEELKDWLFITTGTEVPLHVANGYRDLKLDRPLIERITEEIQRNRIDVATFDPLVTLHRVHERDTGAMDAVVRVFAGIADTTGCSVELSHHTRKLAPGQTDYVVDDIRGAGAVKDAARAVRMLNQMAERDAETLGIPDHERAAYFRVDRVKGNNAPAQKAVWRQFVNVELPNTDDVGVVVAWEYPGAGEETPEQAAAERRAEEMFLHLLDKFTARHENVSSRPSPTYAPSKFAEDREARLARISKAALKGAMQRLLDKGRIRSETYGRGDRFHHLVRGDR